MYVSKSDTERSSLEEQIEEEKSCWSSDEEAALFCDFLEKAWVFDTDKRFTADELLKHGWLSYDEDVKSGRIVL